MSSNKLSPAEWAEIVTSFQRGEKTPKELGEEYGVTTRTINQGLRTRGVSRVSALTEHAQDDEAERAKKEREALVAQAKKKQETYAKYNDAIVQMLMKRLIDADKAGGGGLSIKAKEIRVLRDAGVTLERARRENWEILRIDDLLSEDEQLPDLNVGEYTPEEIEEIRRANEENYLEGTSDDDEFDDFLPVDGDEDGDDVAS